MRTIESELDHEIVSSASVSAPAPAAAPAKPANEQDSFIWRPEAEPTQQRKPEPESFAWREPPEPLPPQKPGKKPRKERGKKEEPRVHKDSVRDEIFDEPYNKKAKSGGHGFSIFLLIIVSLLLLWVVVGVAMTMQWIPYYELGFTWFNTNVFKLF